LYLIITFDFPIYVVIFQNTILLYSIFFCFILFCWLIFTWLDFEGAPLFNGVWFLNVLMVLFSFYFTIFDGFVFIIYYSIFICCSNSHLLEEQLPNPPGGCIYFYFFIWSSDSQNSRTI
jgi:hypothetical protein